MTHGTQAYPTAKPLQRRSFIKLGLAGAVFNQIPLSRAADAFFKYATPSAWSELNAFLGSRLVLPSLAAFNRKCASFNLLYTSIKPVAIAECHSVEDVQFCLQWCTTHGVPLATRGGGHSYAGHSSTEGLLISTRELDSIEYDARTGLVKVGAGSLNGSIYSALSRAGRAITHGRCPTVGVAGFLLGGGIGFNMRGQGLGADSMQETEIVLASGAPVVANANAEVDLYWACRGGAGGNFGINTSFTLKTFSVDSIQVFRMVWAHADERLFRHVIRTLESTPNGIGTRVVLTPARHPSAGLELVVLGQYSGPASEWGSIQKSLQSLQKCSHFESRNVPYWNGQMWLAETGSPGYFQERSRFVNGALDMDIYRLAKHQFAKWSGGPRAEIKFFQTGGKTNQLGRQDMAFVHRDSEWLASIELQWNANRTQKQALVEHAWLNDFYGGLIPLAKGGAYQNFPDPSLTDWRTAYYGVNLEKLRSIKAKVDPGGLFVHAQSI